MKNTSNIKEIISLLEKRIKSKFHRESSGHDIYHLKRVLNLALRIQSKEGGDKKVIAISSFLHDLHRIIKIKRRQFCSPKNSLPEIRLLCRDLPMKEEKLEKILHCIEFHEEYGFSKEGKTVNDLETLIVQDADNLDAMGAIGIGRTFTYCGKHQIPMWRPEIPFRRKFFQESKDDASTIHHFYSKLLRLKENMNTKTAQKLALKRHRFMEKFLAEFFREWRAED